MNYVAKLPTASEKIATARRYMKAGRRRIRIGLGYKRCGAEAYATLRSSE